ncbi:MAG: HEAT repeat domain-containing protein [Planctomycetes bacterium]|nr:HEAT repeat domain-containing protein [Planctomycetota bacterium]
MKRWLAFITMTAAVAALAAGCENQAARAPLTPAEGDDTPYEVLTEALRSPQPQVQALAAETFLVADRRPPLGAVEALVDVPDPRVRTTAVALLGTTRRPQLTELFLRKDRDAEGPVRLAAAFGLAMAGNPSRVTALRDALASPVPSMRRTAAWLIGLMGNPTAVGLLRVKLDDLDAVCVLRVAEAIHRLGSNEGLERVRTLTGHDRHMVRAFAARLLGHMGTTADIPRLEKLCQSRYLDVKYAAMAALAARGDLKRIGMLQDLAEAPDAQSRVLAMTELGESGYTPAIERLARFLKSDIPLERAAAAAAIVRLRSAKGSWRDQILMEPPPAPPQTPSAPPPAPLPGTVAPGPLTPR